MVKAIGAALLLHLLMIGLAHQYLPPAMVPEVPVLSLIEVERESPIAIEFLVPPPVPAVNATPAQPPQASPVANRSDVGSQATSAPGTRISRTQPRPATEAPSEEISAPAKSGLAPGTGTYLSMRHGAADPGIPELNTRIQLSGLGAGGTFAPAGPGGTGSGHRPDLLAAAGPGRGGDSSAWRPSGGGTMRATKQPFNAEIRRDGTIVFGDRPNVALEGIRLSEQYQIPVLAGRFDVTDAVMSALGEKLYPYRKMKLMDESREMRMGMAAASHKESLKSALKNYDKHLRWVWSQGSMSVWKRKEVLFALWDECAEEGSSAVVASAKSIRAMTLAFIRRQLPEDSSDAFTTSELSQLNKRRRSDAAFAPY